MKNNISIIRIKDEFYNLDWSSAEMVAENIFTKPTKKDWEVAEYKGGDTDLIDTNKLKKLGIISEGNGKSDFNFVLLKKYHKEGETENHLYNNYDISDSDKKTISSTPSLIFVYKDEKNIFITTTGLATALIKNSCIDINFPKIFTMQIVDFLSNKTGSYSIDFKKMRGFNFFNGVVEQQSSDRQTTLLETIKSDAQNARELLLSGSIKFTLLQKDIETSSMKYAFIKKDPTISFADRMSFNFSDIDGEPLFKLIKKISDNYKYEYENENFPFMNYYSEVKDSELLLELYKKSMSSENTFIIPSFDDYENSFAYEGKSYFSIKKNKTFVYKKKEILGYYDYHNMQDNIKSKILEHFGDEDWEEFVDLKISVKAADGANKIHGRKLTDWIESFLDIEEKSYFHFNSTWYKINKNLIENIENNYTNFNFDGSVPRGIYSPINLNGKVIKHEGLYNYLFSKNNNGVLIDYVNFHHNSSNFELADIIRFDDVNKKIILSFVKIGKSAHDISALIGQVLYTKKVITNIGKSAIKKLIETYTEKQNERIIAGIKYQNYYYANEQEKAEKISILNKIHDSFSASSVIYEVIYVSNDENGYKNLSSMTKNNLLHFQDIWSSIALSSDMKRVIHDYWNVDVKEDEYELFKKQD